MNRRIPLKDFGYELPEKLIAQVPLSDRDQARLMVINRDSRKIQNRVFSDLDNHLPDKSVIVLNNTKVVPARLLGQKKRNGGKVEVFLLKKTGDRSTYEVMMRPLRRIRVGDCIVFQNEKVTAEVLSTERPTVRFNLPDIMSFLLKNGHMPLPPYIKRQDTEMDKEYYQTVYARHSGSVAAPTAGLHFTPQLLKGLKSQGHDIVNVTLHVNYATFKPVEERNILEHQMHTEEYSVSARAWDTIVEAKKQGRRIVAVGTTSCRVLESVALSQRLRGTTDLFIYPGCRLRMTDHLLTNFHLPYSTLLMLVYAFGGTSLLKRAYKKAVEEKYRFYSYGDAMLIL